MANNEEQAQAAEAQVEEMLPPAHDPDASNYVLQPTAHELLPHVGNPPAGRFLEEVHKESDEVVAKKSDLKEAHPEENRAPLGIGPDDEVPDTSGRAVHNRRSR
jgi:hypothetical protein